MPSKSRNQKSRNTAFETLELRQLLSATITETEILAQLTGKTGLSDIKSFLTKNPLAGANQYISATGSKQLFNSNGTSTLQLALKKGVSVKGAIKSLSNLSFVKWASPNFAYGSAKSEMTPNDPRFPQQSAVNLIQAPQAWDTTTGAGVIVAVLDDGVDFDHEDIAPNAWKNTGEIAGNNIDDDNNGYIDDVNGWDFGNNDNNPKPNTNLDYNFIDSHGTLVASILGGVINNNLGIAGVAGSAKVMPVRFTGYGVTVTSAGIAQSLAYAANNGAKVINVSFSIDPYMNDPAFEAATDLVYSKGVLWVNSAGNSNVENPPRFAIEKAIFLANTDDNDVRYSNSNFGVGIDLSAPGTEVLGAIPGNLYDTGLGTSFSTAITSGVAALVWSAHPTWSRDQVVASLIGTTDNIDAKNPTLIGKLGSGRVNAYKAVTGTLAAPRVRGLAGITEGAIVTSSLNSVTLNLVNVLDASTVSSSAFELRSAGADGSFNTADDVIVPLTMSGSYAYGTNQLKFNAPSELVSGKYRFTAKSATLKDPFAKALDGDNNGTAGGDFVTNFTISGAMIPPSGLVAVLPSYSQTEGELTWVDNSANEVSFTIERSSTADFATIDKTFTALANSTRYNDWGLSQGNTYYYRIRANGVSGVSTPSNVATLNIPLPPSGKPAAPSSFTAVTPSYSQTEAELSWTDNSNNETGFVIERSLVSSFATIDKTFNALPGSNRYNDWGLAVGQTYYYRVKAVNGADSSDYSNTSALTTPGGTVTIPTVPSTLAISAVTGNAAAATVTWLDNSTNETNFELQRSTTTSFTAGTTNTVTLGANIATYADSGLVAGTTYYYRVRSTNSAGASAYTGTVPYTPAVAITIPTAPSTLAVAAVTGNTAASTVTWKDNSTNETNFEVQRSTTNTFTAGTTSTFIAAANVQSYADSGLAAGTTYYYRVRATNSAGGSAYTTTVTFTTPAAVTIPVAPSTLAVAAVAGNAAGSTVTWKDNSTNETNFEVQRSTTNTFTANTTTTFTTAANIQTYSDSGLAAATTYYYRVRSTNTAGGSAYTNTVTYTTQAVPVTAPAAPSNLAATATGTTIKLTWKDNSTNETKFEIVRSTNFLFIGSTTITVAAKATTYNDTGTRGTTYYYAIRAVNAAGNSSYTSVVSARAS